MGRCCHLVEFLLLLFGQVLTSGLEERFYQRVKGPSVAYLCFCYKSFLAQSLLVEVLSSAELARGVRPGKYSADRDLAHAIQVLTSRQIFEVCQAEQR